MSFLRDLIESAFPVAYAAEPEEEVPADSEENEEEVQEGEEENKEEEASGEEAEEAAEEVPESDDPEKEESEEGEEGGDEEGGDDDEEEDEDEDEDDEDEEAVTDPLDDLREECSKTPSCVPYVHHFSECVERVQKEQEHPDYHKKEHKEDCVEEFFHLQHCINDCAAPRLFYKLK